MLQKLVAVSAVVAALGLSSSADAQIRIHASRILDGRGNVISNATVVVQGSRITAIENGSRGRIDYEAKAQRVRTLVHER